MKTAESRIKMENNGRAGISLFQKMHDEIAITLDPLLGGLKDGIIVNEENHGK